MVKRLKIDPFLYRKIEKVSELKKISIEDAVVFLLEKVITPSRSRNLVLSKR